MSGELLLTRRNVRHGLIRARNERIAQLRDDRWPLVITMHPSSWSEVLVDSDPNEREVVDFEGKYFMDVLVAGDPSVPLGEVQLTWPAADEEAAGE